jgi:hypothetical protein
MMVVEAGVDKDGMSIEPGGLLTELQQEQRERLVAKM